MEIKSSVSIIYTAYLKSALKACLVIHSLKYEAFQYKFSHWTLIQIQVVGQGTDLKDWFKSECRHPLDVSFFAR